LEGVRNYDKISPGKTTATKGYAPATFRLVQLRRCVRPGYGQVYCNSPPDIVKSGAMDKKILDTIAEFVGKQWRNPEIPAEMDKADFASLSERAAADISKGKTKARKIIRLAGQSGSGKSSILLPAALEALEAAGINPIHLAVRTFAPYHPHYERIKAEYGADNVRENTNAFALTLLSYTLARLLAQGVYVLHEVTILGAPYENFWAGLLRENGYVADVHAIAMPKEVSDALIDQRAGGSGNEAGRKVAQTSKDFFFRMVPESLEIFRDELPDGNITIWSATEPAPVFNGKCGAPEALVALEKYRALSPYALMEKEKALAARKAWFRSEYST